MSKGMGSASVAALASIVLAAGLTVSPAVAQEATAVRAAGFTWPSYGYWGIIDDQGLSDRIDIEFTSIEDPYASMNLLASGQLDVVLNTLEYAPIGVGEGRPISVVAYYAVSRGADKIIVGPEITEPADLEGRTVGVLEGGLPEIFMSMWMEEKGVDLAQVEKVNVIADEVFAAMIGGTISGGVFWEPYANNVLTAKEGARLVANSADPEWLRSGVIADAIYMNSDFVAENPEAAAEFVRAYFAAIAWRTANPAEGNGLIAEAMKMPQEDVGAVLGTAETDGDLYVYSFLESARLCGAADGAPPFGQVNGQISQIWRDINAWWLRLGHMTETVEPEAGVDCSLMQALVDQGFTGE